MRRRLVVLWASMLCVGALLLTACGGSSDAGGAAPEAEPEVVVDPAEKFIAVWKLAAMEREDLTIVGDFSTITGSEEGLTFDFQKDGAGTAVFGDDEASFTWELVDDNTARVTPVRSGDAEDEEDVPATMDFAYQNNGTLVSEWGSEDDEDGVGTVIFNQTGTLEEYPAIDLAKAEAIASEDQLKGSWVMSGMCMFGMSAYGSPSTLAAAFGEDTDASISFEDGTCVFMGEQYSYEIGEDGATINMADVYHLPVKQLNGMLAVDLSELFGESSAMVYSRG